VRQFSLLFPTSRSRTTACLFPFPWDSHENGKLEFPFTMQTSILFIIWLFYKLLIELFLFIRYVFEGLCIKPKPDTPTVACTLMPMSMVCCMSNFSRIQWFRNENNDWKNFEESYDYNMCVLVYLYCSLKSYSLLMYRLHWHWCRSGTKMRKVMKYFSVK